MKAITCGFFLLLSTFLVAQEFGLASYYADSFEGISTASGEAYDKTKFTCAHNSYPFGTTLKITRLDNNKSVRVRVNDRGPFIKGRVVDLSRVAAEQLDLVKTSTTQVRVDEVDSAPSAPKISDATAKGGSAASVPTTPRSKPKSSATKRPSTYVDKSVPKDKPVAKKVSTTTPTPSKSVARSNSSSSSSKTRPAKSYSKYGLYQIQLMTPKKRGYGVQVASFASYDNVMNKVAELQGKWFDEILVKSEPGNKGEVVHKVILGNFDSLAAAENYKKNLRAKHAVKGFVINLDK